MSKFAKNLYRVAAYHLSEVTLDDLTTRLLETGHIAIIPYKFPINKHLYLNEAFNSAELMKDRRISRDIFRNLHNKIYKNLSQNERDMLGMYKTFGSNASFPYDIDEHRLSSVYNLLDDSNSFVIKTDFGDLRFKFSERDSYGVSEDTLLGYDDEKNKVVIFVDDVENITTLDIINLLLNDNYLHEFQHYVDKIKNQLANDSYDEKDYVAYLNNQNEFKANLQMIIGFFGRFLYKNIRRIDLSKLKRKDEVNRLLNIFLGYMQDKTFSNVISSSAQEMFRKEIYYLNNENKAEFYKQLYAYTSDYYNTEDDLDFNESSTVKNEAMRLFRLEECFIFEE